MDRREAIEWLKDIKESEVLTDWSYDVAIDLAIEALLKVSVYEQVKWERDQALETLYEHGIGLGQIAEETSTTTDLISRQQAVEEIKNAPTITGWNKYASQEEIVEDVERQLRRLFVGAIESLPQITPTEQTIKEIMDFIGGMNMVGEISNEAYTKISAFVDDGTPAERTGEWIEQEDWNGDNYYDCSVCGESFELLDGTPSMNLYHYCPNCGAKMGGAE